MSLSFLLQNVISTHLSFNKLVIEVYLVRSIKKDLTFIGISVVSVPV